jgi:hemoglobin
MTIEYVRYRIDAATAPTFEDDYRRAGQHLAASPNCLGYELARCAEEPDRYVLRVHWDSIDGHLEGFRRSAHFREFFSAIRPYVSAIEEMQHYTATDVAHSRTGDGPAVPTMYEWAGGEPAFIRLCEEFYQRVVTDPLLGTLFAGMDDDHPQHVATWLAEVFGGPARYSDHHGGYENMLGHHIGLGITEPQRRRSVELNADAADAAELPTDPEFRAAFMSYIEWGTRLALANSQPGASPPKRAPVPRWGWGVAPPPSSN